MSTPLLKKYDFNQYLNQQFPKLTKLSLIEHLLSSLHESKVNNLTWIKKSSVLFKFVNAKMKAPHNKTYYI